MVKKGNFGLHIMADRLCLLFFNHDNMEHCICQKYYSESVSNIRVVLVTWIGEIGSGVGIMIFFSTLSAILWEPTNVCLLLGLYAQGRKQLFFKAGVLGQKIFGGGGLGYRSVGISYTDKRKKQKMQLPPPPAPPVATPLIGQHGSTTLE